MDDLAIGDSAFRVFEPGPENSAEAVGNRGVVVVSSASLIWFLETACGDAIARCCDQGEVSVGVGFNLRHLMPSLIGEPVDANGRITGIQGNKVDFDVTASSSGRILMEGTHCRAIVDLGQFLDEALHGDQ